MPGHELYLKWLDLFRFWEESRQEMFAVLASQPPEALSWRPAEHKNVKSILYHLRHLCNAEHYWIDHVVGGRPFVRHASRDYPDLPSIEGRMRELRAATIRFVEGLDPGDLDRVYEGHGRPRSLRWILWHVPEHEGHHKAQCYHLLRLRTPDAAPLLP